MVWRACFNTLYVVGSINLLNFHPILFYVSIHYMLLVQKVIFPNEEFIGFNTLYVVGSKDKEENKPEN